MTIPSRYTVSNPRPTKILTIIAIILMFSAILPIENKNVTKLDGGCYIKDETTGSPTINMTKFDNNMHTEESCKLNAAIKQHNYLKQQLKDTINGNVVYYSLVENDATSPSNGYYDCYVSNVISETIEEKRSIECEYGKIGDWDISNIKDFIRFK